MRSETHDSQIVKSFIYVCVYVNGDWYALCDVLFFKHTHIHTSTFFVREE
jgi:hypothetical protein